MPVRTPLAQQDRARDVRLMRRKLYASLAEAATVQQNRDMGTEVKYVVNP